MVLRQPFNRQRGDLARGAHIVTRDNSFSKA